MDDLSDRDLLARAVDGDVTAFDPLFERHARSVYNFCFRRTADWALAEDLMSVVFLEAWRHRDAHLDHQSALPWLLGIATNVLRNHGRSLQRYRAALDRVVPPSPQPDFAEELAQRLDDERRMARVLILISGLSVEDQEVLALCVWSQLSYEEAAEALEIPVGTVRSRLARARARLRDLESSNGHGITGRDAAGAMQESITEEER